MEKENFETQKFHIEPEKYRRKMKKSMKMNLLKRLERCTSSYEKQEKILERLFRKIEILILSYKNLKEAE